MSISPRPLLISSGIGTLGLLLISLLDSLLSRGLATSLLGSLSSGSSIPPQGFATPGLLCCSLLFLNFTAYVGIGILYIYLYAGQSIPTPEAGAVGGALSALVASLASGIIGLIGSTAYSSLIIQRISGPFGNISPTIGLTANLTLLVSFVSLCFGTVVAALIAAIAGAIGGAILSSRQREIA